MSAIQSAPTPTSSNNQVNNAIHHLTHLKDICNQVDKYKIKILEYIYNVHISKSNKTETFKTFKDKITTKIRNDRNYSNPNNQLTEDEINILKCQCKFVLWNKGNLRQCNHSRIENEAYCKRHLEKDNVFESAYNYLYNSDEDDDETNDETNDDETNDDETNDDETNDDETNDESNDESD